MINNVTEQTVDTVRERERERVILTKICFVNHAQKSNKKFIKEIINIKEKEIGYMDRIISYV